MRRVQVPPLALALAFAFACASACASATTVARSAPGRSGPRDPAESYLERLIAGDSAALLASFAGEPTVDDPLGGHVRGREAFDRFVAYRHLWLGERAARVRPGRTTRGAARTVVEATLELREGDRAFELPIALVGDRAPDGRLSAIRVYHNTWSLSGEQGWRPPLLPTVPDLRIPDAVADYQGALLDGDVERIVATFEPDGYFREGSGEVYFRNLEDELQDSIKDVLSEGAISLEPASLIDDGLVAAIEFNVVLIDANHNRLPEAGLGVFERGKNGRLTAVRFYDDLVGPRPVHGCG
jgi:hypothetical protein